MDWSTHVHTAQTADTNPTVVISFATSKYLFNIGENTTRAFIQGGIPVGGGWKRTKSIFLTGLTPERSAGVPGMAMTLADATISQLNIVGPPGLLHYLASMRLYTYRDSMPVSPIEAPIYDPHDTEPPPLYKDDNITVYPLQIYPEPSQVLGGSIDTPSDSLKRKRTDSPVESTESPPRKRANTLSSDDPQVSLEEFRAAQPFNPSDLTAHPNLAQEWRKLMIGRIFPKELPPLVVNTDTKRKSQKSSKKGKKKQKVKTQDPSEPAPSNVLAEVKPLQEALLPTPEVNANNGDDIQTSPDNGMKEQNPETQGPSEPPASDAKTEPEPLEKDNWRRPSPPEGYLRQLPSYTSQPGLTQSYIVVGPRVRGKFDAFKSSALGVPSGPLVGKLTKGETITIRVKSKRTNTDGVEEEIEEERTVRPEDVMGKSEPPGVVIILDVPSLSHIDPLISAFKSPFHSRFRSQRAEDTEKYSVRVIYHLLGDGVLEDTRYKQFMRGFSQTANHFISSRAYLSNPAVFHSVAYTSLQLNKIDSTLFPIPYHCSNETHPLSDASDLPELTRPMTANTLINMRPPRSPVTFTPADCGNLFLPAVASGELELEPAVQEEIAIANANIQAAKENQYKKAFPGCDLTITTLGTGSAIPSKYRNVSSTLVQIPRWGNILFDAGEGTWGQLARKFGYGEDGKEDVWTTLRNLKCIFISHVHADHHLGLAQLLVKRKQLDPPPTEPLFLVSIRPVHLYLRELSDLYDLGLDLDDEGLSSGSFKTTGVVQVMSDALHFRHSGAYPTYGKWQLHGNEPWTDYERSQVAVRQLCGALGLESFETVDVPHRTKAYGAVIKSKERWSVVFSGDTQPSTALVIAGKDATVLIHEATMADDQEEMALKKAHSTFGQALSIGKQMNAKHIILTHFSQRYSALPSAAMGQPSEEGSTRDEPVVALALDHASFRVGDMWKFKHYLPAIEKCLGDGEGEGESEGPGVAVADGLAEVDAMEVDVDVPVES